MLKRKSRNETDNDEDQNEEAEVHDKTDKNEEQLTPYADTNVHSMIHPNSSFILKQRVSFFEKQLLLWQHKIFEHLKFLHQNIETQYRSCEYSSDQLVPSFKVIQYNLNNVLLNMIEIEKTSKKIRTLLK